MIVVPPNGLPINWPELTLSFIADDPKNKIIIRDFAQFMQIVWSEPMFLNQDGIRL